MYSYAWNKKIVFRALVLFMVLVIFFGTFYRSIGFDSDCFGYIHKMEQGVSFKDLFCKPFHICYESSNEVIDVTKASVLYRPLAFALIYWFYQFWGTYAYAYYFLSILFHACSFVLIYLIFLYIIPDPYAWFLALLAAIFPAHTPSLIGLTTNIVITYTLCITALFLWILFKQIRFWYLYFISGLLFFCSLFVYEMPLIFPFVICWYLFLFDRKNIIKDSWLFFVFEVCYLVLRYLLIGRGSFSIGGSITQLLQQACLNVIQSIKPFMGMQEASWVLVGFLLFLFVLIFVMYCWIQKDERKKMLFYATSFLACSWPLFLCNSSSRYFYLGIPFFCLILYELLLFVVEKSVSKNKLIFVLSFLFFCIGWSGIYTTKALMQREAYTHGRDIGYARLARFIQTPEDKFIILGSLHAYNNELFLMQSGVSQAISLFTHLDQKNIFHVKELAIMEQHDAQSYFDIIPIPGGYRFKSCEPQNLFMMCPYSWKEGVPVVYSMGMLIPHKIIDGWKCAELSIMFDKKWLTNLEHTHIVTWHPEIWDFGELPREHLRSVIPAASGIALPCPS